MDEQQNLLFIPLFSLTRAYLQEG